jgi:hypothetical protein
MSLGYNRTGVLAAHLCDDANYHIQVAPAVIDAVPCMVEFGATVTTEPFLVSVSYNDGANWTEDVLVPAGCTTQFIGTWDSGDDCWQYKKSAGNVSVQAKYFYHA